MSEKMIFNEEIGKYQVIEIMTKKELEYFLECSKSEDKKLRGYAAWIFMFYGNLNKKQYKLLDTLKTDSDPDVRRQAKRSLLYQVTKRRDNMFATLGTGDLEIPK